MIKKFKFGFTIIEISVAVAIVCLLITLSVMATLQTRVRARDSKRISDATTIMNALESYYKTNQSYPTSITGGELAVLGSSSLLPKLPSNPFPRTDGGCANQDYVYTTTSTGYQLTFCLGADHGRYGQGIVICKNGNCGYKEDCTGEITDAEGIRYPIVRIGDQCWMASNLKSKRRPDGTCININRGYTVDPLTCLTSYNGQNYGGFGGCPTACVKGSRRDCIKTTLPIYGEYSNQGWNDRGLDIISSSYDYPPSSTASACNLRGALYTWMGAMNLPDELPVDCSSMNCSSLIFSDHQGVCPNGWHIPSDQEFNILEATLTDSPNTCNTLRNSHSLGQDSCQNAGSKLISGGTSGFNAIPLGIRDDYSGKVFLNIDQRVQFWTSTIGSNQSEAISRSIDVGVAGTYRQSEDKNKAFAIRCIRGAQGASLAE